MKNSIAAKLSRQIMHLLGIALAVLFIGSFILVYKTVFTQTEALSLATVTVFSDLVTDEAKKLKVSLDTNQADMILKHGDYFCKWYDIDYAFICVPDEKHETVTYIALSHNSDKNYESITGNYIGHTESHKMSKKELEVWNGKRDYASIVFHEKPDHEICTLIRIKDTYGNKYLAGVDKPYSEIYKNVISTFSLIAAVIIAVTVGIYFAVYMIVRKTVAKPAKLISGAMHDFLTVGDHSQLESDAKATDEFAMITNAFNTMSANINDYIVNINALTRAQEHQQTQLDIASRIQQGFLPKKHFSLSDFSVDAVMTPAKDVGGDLYDYLPLDEHRTLLVIADVSGKGISAAIYMAVTLTLMRMLAKNGLEPAEILQKTNDMLSQNNAALLFATAFVCIYDSSTGMLTYSNAGHNIPYITSKNGIRTPDGARNTLLGLYFGEQYTQASEPLGIGETLFLYTDGVNEATDENNDFYGTDRLEACLRSFRSSKKTNLIEHITESLRAFTGSAEQHDDITMLVFTVGSTLTLELDAELNEFKKIKESILALPIKRGTQLELCLAAEERFANICNYAYDETHPQDEKVIFRLSFSDKVTMTFTDSGKPFDPTADTASPDDYDIDTQIGGLGNFLAFASVDDVEYMYKNNKNILTLTKFIKEE